VHQAGSPRRSSTARAKPVETRHRLRPWSIPENLAFRAVFPLQRSKTACHPRVEELSSVDQSSPLMRGVSEGRRARAPEAAAIFTEHAPAGSCGTVRTTNRPRCPHVHGAERRRRPSMSPSGPPLQTWPGNRPAFWREQLEGFPLQAFALVVEASCQTRIPRGHGLLMT